MTIGEQVEAGAGLFEQGPEHDRGQDEEHRGEDAIAFFGMQLGDSCKENVQHQTAAKRAEDVADQFLILDRRPAQQDHGEAGAVDCVFLATLDLGRILGLALAEQKRLAEDEENETDQHTETGEAEAVLPAIGLAEIAADDRRGRRADVNAHVEDGVGGIAAHVGAAVELADDHGDVRLQEARTHDDERQRHPEDVDDRIGLAAIAFKSHEEVAERQQDGPEQDRLALADIAVRKIAADDGRDVDQRGVGTVDDRRFAVGEQPMLDEVEDQQGAHAVIGEALPHFGHEQQEQALGMSDHFFLRTRHEDHAADQEGRECDHRDPEGPHFECGAEREEHAFDHEYPVSLIFSERTATLRDRSSPKKRAT